MKVKRYTIIAVLVGLWVLAEAQPADSLYKRLVPYVVVDGDTMPYVSIEQVVKVGRRKYRSSYDMRQYYRLIRNLKVTYPYAQIAKREILELNNQLISIESSMERKRLIKATEKRLFKEYEGQLSQMTISQGKMLIKLIKRETGQTSYQLVKELKGGFSAGFWQGIARLFGSSLKLDYDPHGEDKLLEDLIVLYEEGVL